MKLKHLSRILYNPVGGGRNLFTDVRREKKQKNKKTLSTCLSDKISFFGMEARDGREISAGFCFLCLISTFDQSLVGVSFSSRKNTKR